MSVLHTFRLKGGDPGCTYAGTDLTRTFQETASVIEPCSFLCSSMVRHKDGGYPEDKDGKTCPRDSGYDSLSNRLSILDRLLHTHPIWLQLSLSEEEAAEVLQAQPPGVRAKTQVEAGMLLPDRETLRDIAEKFFPVSGSCGFPCRCQIQCRKSLGSIRRFQE